MRRPSPSRVPLLVVLALLLAGAATRAHAQQHARYTQRDSIALARDLDGDGRIDYVVIQTRVPGDPDASPRQSRIALFMAGAVRTGRPTWATPWSDGMDEDVSFGGVTQVAPQLSLLEVDDSGGDYDGTTLFLVERGRVRRALVGGADYGQGFFEMRQEGGQTVLDVTLAHLAIEGRPIASAARCADRAWPAAHLRFDVPRRRFVVERTYCAPQR